MVARVAENVVIVSNRGPLSFSHDGDGNLVAQRGAGGVASSLAPLVRDTGASWMAAAISDADRDAAAAGTVEAEGFRFRMLAVDPDAYRMAYDVVSNSTLWFLHHGLWELARRPRFDRRWREAWDAYRAVNHTFARAVIDEAPADATVLVQDYHFALVGTWLAQERPDLKAVHFTHIPFCDPDAIRILPDDVASELLAGLASHTSCGFHARRWAQNFEACCQALWGWNPSTFVSPLLPPLDVRLDPGPGSALGLQPILVGFPHDVPVPKGLLDLVGHVLGRRRTIFYGLRPGFPCPRFQVLQQT